MTTRTPEWRECYRHPGQPALKDCAGCGRPICGKCASESGDPLYCKPCMDRSTDEAAEPRREKRLRLRPGRKKIPVGVEEGEEQAFEPHLADQEDRTWLDVGEVTVFEDGTVEEPSLEPEPEIEPAEKPQEKIPFKPAEEFAEEEKPEELEPVASGAAAVLEGQEESPEIQMPERDTIPPEARRIKKRAVTAAPEVARERRWRPLAWTGERFEALADRLPEDETRRQLLSAVPYGVIGGLITYGFWIVLSVRYSWMQTAVLTAGFVIPWAVFKSTTMKKKYGKPVFTSSPDAIWMALLSAAIMLALFPLAEYIAFRVVYRSSRLKDPLGAFLSGYFEFGDIVQIVLGFVFAFGVPFFLKRGEQWGLPFRRKKRKGEGTES